MLARVKTDLVPMVADRHSQMRFEVSNMEPASLIMPLLKWHSTAKKVIAVRFNRICVYEIACWEATASCRQSAYGTHAGMLDVAVGIEMILLTSVRLVAGPSVEAWGPHEH